MRNQLSVTSCFQKVYKTIPFNKRACGPVREVEQPYLCSFRVPACAEVI